VTALALRVSSALLLAALFRSLISPFFAWFICFRSMEFSSGVLSLHKWLRSEKLEGLRGHTVMMNPRIEETRLDGGEDRQVVVLHGTCELSLH
jgi:hypothetical protein